MPVVALVEFFAVYENFLYSIIALVKWKMIHMLVEHSQKDLTTITRNTIFY